MLTSPEMRGELRLRYNTTHAPENVPSFRSRMLPNQVRILGKIHPVPIGNELVSNPYDMIVPM